MQIADYWEPAKKLLNDPVRFLESLQTFDRDNIPDSVIKKIEPIIQVRMCAPCDALCARARAWAWLLWRLARSAGAGGIHAAQAGRR